MLVSIREYARRRGVSDTAVHKAIESGRITTVSGKIDPEAADKQWAENTNPAYHPSRAPQSSGNDAKHSYQSSRAMREAYEAALKKLEYEERSGKLISAAQVEVEAFNAARIARDILLTIPHRVAPQIIGKSDISEIEKILRKEIIGGLAGLTGFFDGNKS
jgi:hypothetical protein